MTDDLVKRLRSAELGDMSLYDVLEAANRIEKDAQHIDEMYELVAAMNADHTASKTRIKKLEAALRKIAAHYRYNAEMAHIARKALDAE